ncbi:ATP-dependent RNA helicase DHX37/DHR1, partial [Phenoliferia sp. Uapishka_3]
MALHPVGAPRPRYNEKGRRASAAAAAATKKRAYVPDDSNADIIDPEQRKKRKAEEAIAKSAEVAAAPKMSSKKKKRLEAYINRKLKKEDRVGLIASLATTQTTNLSLRSSSALGSKQFTTLTSRLAHTQTVEQSRRSRAQGLLKKVKGRGHHSASEGSASDEEGAEDEGVDQEMGLANDPIPSTSLRGINTLADQKPPPFNASGSLGIVNIPSSLPTPSSSTSTSTDSPRPPPAPSSIPTQVGSGLSVGITTTIVKRKKKEKGRMRALAGVGEREKGKGKAKEETDESDFDSSDSAGDGDESGDEKDGEEEEEWGGIKEDGDDIPSIVEPEGPGDNESAASDSEDDEEEESSSDSDPSGPTRPPREKGSFQAWAEAQVLSAAGLSIPLPKDPDPTSFDGPYVPLLPAGSGFFNTPNPDGLTGPLGALIPEKELPSMPPQRSTHIPIERTEEMQKQRQELPIVKEEDRLMDAIRGNAVIVVCGETGSGKTTQIGQFLLEAGWGDASSDNPGMVAITQPRRVAALSTSVRVRAELCLPPSSSIVAHRIRYSSTTSPDTKLVFMTDGVLLRELAGDFLLSKYSVVVIDEAHERGVNTDVLIGVLSRVARLREEMWKEGKEGAKPLRLIIMSATLRVSDFAENTTLFPSAPPVLHITARQHPVTLHFTRKTSPDYMEEAYKKVCRIHARLPPGGILVFCTGQNEIVALVKRLEKKFGKKAIKERKERNKQVLERNKVWEEKKKARKAGKEEVEEESEEEEMMNVEMGDDIEVEDLDLGDDKDLAADVDDGLPMDDPEDLESSDDEDSKINGVDMEEDTEEPLYILPLYSLLSTEKQMKVFEEPPPNCRLVVIATNVAETSITIPNIKYVVDAGRAKERKFDVGSGIQTFEVSWISKAAASQRAGRAGRTGPGHCYRLYSSAVFENYFDQHTKPEILRMPIEGVVLQMKSMNIDAVANFPFPTPPDRESLRRAEKTLVNLGALEASNSSSKVGGRITELGRSMSLFPLSPRFSKMLVAGQQHGCLPYVIAIVCALSVGDPFIRETNLGDGEEDSPEVTPAMALTPSEIRHIRDPELRAKEELKVTRKAFFSVQSKYAALGKGASDVFKLLSVVGAYEYEGGKDSFCEANFVRTKAMQEIHKLRSQISRIVQSTYPGIDAGFVPKLQPPSETQVILPHYFHCSCPDFPPLEKLKVLRQLITSAFIDQVAVRKDLVDKSSSLSYSKVSSTRGVPYLAFGVEEDLFIHPSSGVFHSSPAEFIIFQDLHRTSKVWMKTITKINPAWLPVLGKPLCTFSKPIETAATVIAAKGAPGSANGDTRKTFVIPRFGAGQGIELKPVLVEQRLEKGRWVFT